MAVRAITKCLLLWILATAPARSQVNILTANGGNDRTNASLQEVQLVPSSVNPSNFGKLAVFPVDGPVYAQPLYAGGILTGGVPRNVLIVATMHNSIFAFDADATASSQPLWQVSLGKPVPAAMLFGPYGDIGGEVGILGTPAIDLQRNVIYVVSDTLSGPVPAFYLHALDLATGAERLGGPIVIKASVPGNGSGAASDGTVPFDPMQHIQRPGLLLANGAVYISFGSHGDQSPYHGWLMSYDASDLTRQLAVYMSTPNGDGGSIWQSGRGPAADDRGNVYAVTGNGDYDRVRNFGQSFLKLSGTLALSGSFTPVGWKSMSDNDADLAAGPALISGTRLMVGADKSGNFYVLDTDALAQPGMDNMGGAQVFPVTSDSIFNFAVWSRPQSALVFVQGAGEPLKSFEITPAGFNMSPVSMASNSVRGSRIGMTLSANGTQDGTGILWEVTGNYNDATQNGTLHAYDASNLTSELWNSDMNPGRDTMPPLVKFVGPTVANGRVYVPTLANAVVVYGLLSSPGDHENPPVINAVGSAASYAADALSPGEVIAIFGSNLGPTSPAGIQLDGAGLVATSIADTQVLFDGVPGPMVWASAAQVNVVAPFGISLQSTQVQVQYQGRISNTFPMNVAPSAPGIFSSDGSGAGQAIVLNQDGTVNSAASPAPPGSVITLYATGAGQLSPAAIDGSVTSADNLPTPVLPVSAQIGGRDATVMYAGGAPGIVAGVIQVNLKVPDTAPRGPAIPITLRVGDGVSQSNLTVAIGSQ